MVVSQKILGNFNNKSLNAVCTKQYFEPQRRYFISSYDKQHVFKEAINEFMEWTLWQREHFICKCVQRTSTSLLNSFKTTLEPMFHRDYQISFDSGFKSNLIEYYTIESTFQHNNESSKATSFYEQDKRISQISTLNRSKLQEKCFNHLHKIPRRLDSLSTVDFFPVNKTLKSKPLLGQYMKPKERPLVDSTFKDFKQEKLWLPPLNRVMQQPSKETLLKNFNSRIEYLLSSYRKWSNAEQGDFFLNILECCSDQELKFLLECISTHVKDLNDISRLSDKTMIQIFEFLPIQDLMISVPLVCKHWYKLSNTDKLRERKAKLKTHSNKVDLGTESPKERKDFVFTSEKTEEINESNFEDYTSNVNSEELSISPVGFTEFLMHYPNRTHGADTSSISMVSEDESECESEDAVVSTVNNIDFQSSCSNATSFYSPHLSDSKPAVNIVDGESEEVILKDEELLIEQAVDVRQKLVQPKNIHNDRKDKDESRKDNHTSEIFAQVPIGGLKAIKRVRKLEGHHDSVLCVQFESKRIMTGSSDRTVRLWDARSGRNYQILYGHQGGVRCLQFDKDYIITGSWDTTVIVWDGVNFDIIKTLSKHKDCVSCLETTEELLFTGSHDNTICIFKKHSWELLATLERHRDSVSSLLVLSDDELLSGSHDRTIIVWDIYTQTARKIFGYHKSSILCLKYSGKLLAAGCMDGTLTFWNYTTGDKEGSVKAHDSAVNSLCFAGSKFFTGGSDGKIKEWDLSTCTCLRSLTGHNGSVLCLRVSNKRIISGSADGTARLWDFSCSFQQYGGPYGDMNKIIIPSHVMNEKQYEKLNK